MCDDKYQLVGINTPGSVEIEIDKCDQCGKVLDARTDGVLFEVKTDKIFCVSCALRNEGATKEEIADPEFVKVATSGVNVRESRALAARPANDLIIENGEFPIIEQNQFAKAEGETDAEFRRRIIESFLSRGGGCTKDDIRGALSMVDGVELVGIMEHIEGPGTIEIIIIGEGFNRSDITEALHNYLPAGVATVGTHTDNVFNVPYRWSEYRTVDEFFARFFRDFNVETASDAALDRLGALVGVTRRIEDGDFFHPGEPDANFRERLLGVRATRLFDDPTLGKKGKDK